MKTFEELKKDLLERAKKHNACQDGYRMGLNAKSKQDLLKAITNNWYWVLSASKMIDANYLENNFSEEELAEAGIYTRKEHTSNAKSFACGSATVKIKETGVSYDHSNCNDPVYARLVEERMLLDAKIKEREAFLKTVPDNTTVIDDETGEIYTIHPAIRMAKTSYSITFNKQ